jgi:uncharacterized SAM-binding protein YcdF (DUF218 family)
VHRLAAVPARKTGSSPRKNRLSLARSVSAGTGCNGGRDEQEPSMVSTLLLCAALALALAGAALHDRAGRWRRAARPLLHLLGPAAAAASLATAPSWTVVEKLLTALVLPAGALWAAAFGLGWWLVLRQRRRQAAAALLAWGAFSLAGNVWVGQAMLAWLEAGFQPAPPGARFDAVLVLGGGTDLTPWRAPQLGTAGDRLRVGAELFASGRTEVLVTSGSSIAELGQKQERDLAHETAALWEQMGVPRGAIVEVPGPKNTSQEVAALGALVRARGWRRVGLVTSASHLRRAMRLAGRHGLRATPIPADVRGEIQPASMVGLVPSGQGFHAVHVASREIAAALVGR